MGTSAFLKRDLDGIYVRAKNPGTGKWDSLCFSDMPEKERMEWIQKYEIDGILTVIAHLSDCLSNAYKAVDEEVTTERSEEELKTKSKEKLIDIANVMANELRKLGDKYDIVCGYEE